MKIEFAGCGGGSSYVSAREYFLQSYFYKNRLFSYFYLQKQKLKMNKSVELFLDSGAFSAKTQGVTINIDEYIEFIKTNAKYIHVYANLDVIGDPAATLVNQKIMEKAGLNPIPVFHYGEPLHYLDDYVSKYDYIAIGGMVKTPKLVDWLDNIWHNHLTDAEGFPKVKVHGFGLTSLRLMLRFPWYSVDSTSWVVTGRLGSIYIPKKKDGAYQYEVDPLKLAVSSLSPSLTKSEQHFKNLSPIKQKQVLDYLHVKGYVLGKSDFKHENQDYQLADNEKWAEKKPKDKTKKRLVEILVERGVSNDYRMRDEVNILYFLDLERNYKQYPWALNKETQKTLF